MDYDTDKVDDAVLALLYLTLHNDFRAWKGFDWDAMDRLFEKGMIDDPKNKNKSITFTPAGLEKSEALFKQLFQRKAANQKEG
jgi:Domain of unknown function (DUF6429)